MATISRPTDRKAVHMPRLFSSVGRRAGQRLRPKSRDNAAVPLLNGKVVDLTGPGITERWGVDVH